MKQLANKRQSEIIYLIRMILNMSTLQFKFLLLDNIEYYESSKPIAPWQIKILPILDRSKNMDHGGG